MTRTTRVAARAQRFRPDLEGLRAVAVILVLLFHARVTGFGGGYVGVDVFFVLSGFLITGLIVRELRETGTVSLPAFYARRARRLLPAAAVALVATLIASAFVLPPLRLPDVAADGASAALYAGNLRFAFQATDYLQAELDPSPLLHYWSLGVEEQFYLFWPALLMGAAWLGARRFGMAVVAAAIAVVGVGSLVLSLVLTEVSQPWAFFSLPARAWELSLGAGLALAAERGLELPRRAAAAAGLAGLVLIVGSGAVISIDTAFPGTAALLPTGGAALVIAAGMSSTLSWPSRVLSVAPVRWLGRISYSLYLWHWPLIVLPAAALGTGADLPFGARIGLAALAIPIAAASQRWIEEPIRRGRLSDLRPRWSLAMAAGLAIVIATVSVGIGGGLSGPVTAAGSAPVVSDSTLEQQLVRAIGTPEPSPTSSETGERGTGESGAPGTSPLPSTRPGPVPVYIHPALEAARDDLPRLYREGCVADYPQVTPSACVYGDPASTTNVVLLGDSHAAQWFPGLESLASSKGWRLTALTKTLCAVVDHRVWNAWEKRSYPECDKWRAAALARIAAERPALVVVSNSMAASLDIGGRQVASVDAQDVWDAALGRSLAALVRSAGHVVLIGDTPESKVDAPVCLSAHRDDALACATPVASAADQARLDADRRTASDAGAGFIDPTPWLCPTEPCPAVIGGLLVYRDRDHMTRSFSAALAPYLASELPPLD